MTDEQLQQQINLHEAKDIARFAEITECIRKMTENQVVFMTRIEPMVKAFENSGGVLVSVGGGGSGPTIIK